MATLFSGSLIPEASQPANIQGWATFVEQVVTTLGGWTVTSDTGQTPPGSLPGATAQTQKLGYRVYQMNDDFSVDFPVFMRIDYGSGQVNFSNAPTGYGPGMWFQFGGGTDGAGNITGLYWNGVGWQPGCTIQTNSHPSQSRPTYVTRNYASGDNSRFIFGLFLSDANITGFGADQTAFSLERTRDKDGNYTGDGLMISYCDNQLYGGGGIQTALNATKYIICNRPGGMQPGLEGGLAYVYIRHTPAYSYDGRVPCAMASHFRGLAQQPGMNFLIMGVNDMFLEAQYVVNMYGQPRTYQHLRYLAPGKAYAGQIGTSARPGASTDTGCRISILYE